MNLDQAKTKAIQLILEYSVDGSLVPAEDNLDYTLLMNSLANDAQLEIADRIPIDTSYTIEQAKDIGTYNKYDLPSDFKKHKYINLNDELFRNYRIENGKLLIPKSYEGTFEHFYQKYPTVITESTDGTYEFEVELTAQELIPYKMGGMAISSEKAMVSDKLLNIYYSRLAGLKKPMNDYPRQTVDVYNVGGSII